MLRASRLSPIPLIWRWHWIRIHFTFDGTSSSWLWEKVQVGIFYLPSSTGGFYAPFRLMLYVGVFLKICIHIYNLIYNLRKGIYIHMGLGSYWIVMNFGYNMARKWIQCMLALRFNSRNRVFYIHGYDIIH